METAGDGTVSNEFTMGKAAQTGRLFSARTKENPPNYRILYRFPASQTHTSLDLLRASEGFHFSDNAPAEAQ